MKLLTLPVFAEDAHDVLEIINEAVWRASELNGTSPRNTENYNQCKRLYQIFKSAIETAEFQVSLCEKKQEQHRKEMGFN